MSLQVCFPFTEEDPSLYSNKGLGYINEKIFNGGPTNGITGQSFYSANNNQNSKFNLNYDDQGISTSPEFSFCTWINNSYKDQPLNTLLLGHQFSTSNTIQINFYSNDVLSLHINDIESISISGLNLFQWNHIVVTFSKGKILIYINGKYSNYINTNFTEFDINGEYRFSSGRFNDYRIYNHCLSPAEIKELSKAKIFHYKLDATYIVPSYIQDLSFNGYNTECEEITYNSSMRLPTVQDCRIPGQYQAVDQEELTMYFKVYAGSSINLFSSDNSFKFSFNPSSRTVVLKFGEKLEILSISVSGNLQNGYNTFLLTKDINYQFILWVNNGAYQINTNPIDYTIPSNISLNATNIKEIAFYSRALTPSDFNYTLIVDNKQNILSREFVEQGENLLAKSDLAKYVSYDESYKPIITRCIDVGILNEYFSKKGIFESNTKYKVYLKVYGEYETGSITIYYNENGELKHKTININVIAGEWINISFDGYITKIEFGERSDYYYFSGDSVITKSSNAPIINSSYTGGVCINEGNEAQITKTSIVGKNLIEI